MVSSSGNAGYHGIVTPCPGIQAIAVPNAKVAFEMHYLRDAGERHGDAPWPTAESCTSKMNGFQFSPGNGALAAQSLMAP
jgi:hypothetical protein